MTRSPWGTLLAATALAATLPACHEPGPPPVQSLVAPFPSDLFTVADETTITGVRIDLAPDSAGPLIDPALDLGLWKRQELIGWLEERDGFSTVGPIYLLLGATIAADGLPADAAASVAPAASIFLVDLQPGAHYGERAPVVATVTEVEDQHLGSTRVLALRPAAPLRAASPYGVVVLRRARDDAGQLLPQSDLFAVLSGTREIVAQSPLAPRIAHGRRRMAPLVDYLRRERIALDDVAEGFVFTTQSSSMLLSAIRHYLHGSEAPPLSFRWTGAHRPADLPSLPGDVGDLSSVAVVFKGELDVPDLRDAEGGIAVPLRRDRTLRVPFILAMPKAAGPSPVVMLQHGNGGRKELALHVAPVLAARGIATAAIDHMGHGELAHTGMFFDLLHVPRLGGSFIQTITNGLRLVQALGEITTLQSDGTSYAIAHDKWLGYVGESLGGMSGVGLVAAEPEVRAAVLNVAGGGLAMSIAGGYVEVLGADRLLMQLGFLALIQLLLDPADPANHARALWREPDAARGATQVLMQNVVGDSLGVDTAATLASAIGVTYVCPCPSAVPLPALPRRDAPAPPPGLFYFPVGKHGFLLSNDGDTSAARAVREQAAHFLGTYFESGAATIVDPFASR